MKNYNKQRMTKIARYAGIACCVLIGIFVGALWFYRDSLPPTSELHNFTLRSGSEVYDRNGKMVYLFAFEKRKLVSLKELPPYLIDALLVTEDKNFYHHFGIDIIGNIRAIVVDIIRMDFSQGASTITQQMARNMFLTLDKQVSRKMKELILALRIEREFSKDEILEIYFNKIFWGGQLHGVETAALFYFGKHARDLSLAESASLIGMIQRPNYYNPQKHPERLLERRNMILKKMLKARKITAEEYEIASAAEMKSDRSSMRQYASDYFIEHIRLYLERKYGTERLFEGGLKIYTTLDMELSAYADSVLNDYLSKAEKGYGSGTRYDGVAPNSVDINTRYLQGGLVLMENSTGQVLSMIGGRNFVHSKFNRMTQAKRQSGSAIKPIYYTAAVERGYTPATIIKDAPLHLKGSDEKAWNPQNFSRKYYGFTRMRTAITHSYNIWAVKTVMDIGLPAVNDAFQRFGINAKAKDLSAALGAYEITPINLISAYTAFPNGGARTTPIFITKVEDMQGKVLERKSGNRIKVCSPDVAYIMTSLLQSVTTSGTGAAARNNYMWPVAGKTGTSNDHRDAWFIGFNKKYTLGIWNGFDHNATISASAVCAPIWGKIMTKAIRLQNKGRLPRTDDPRYGFSMPEGIVTRTINPTSGFASSSGIEEVFIESNVPPVVEDTLRFNFYPTRWGYRDELETE
ncbi:MAG: PBP1A family penicillin-binding protein [Candidatus Cloacimonas sp.]|jgi:penicillin-binding protein 1A|nr:PBP1A family penicillin-binding protein [Candidatus Cloacimonas sp.]